MHFLPAKMTTIRKASDSCPVSAGIGFASALLWISMFGSALDASTERPFGGDGFLWVAIGILSLISVPLTLCMPVQSRTSPTWTRPLAGVVGALISLLSPLLFSFGLSGWLCACGVGAACASCLLLRWGELLGQMSARSSLICVSTAAISLFVGKITAVLCFSGEQASLGLLATLPAITLLLLNYCIKHVRKNKDYAFYNSDNITSLGCVVAFCALFSITLKLMDSITPKLGQDMLISCLAGIVLLVVGLRLFAFKRPLDFFGDVRTLLVVTSIATASCVLIWESVFDGIAAAVSLGIRELTRFYLFLLQADIARHSEYPPSVIFGVGWACCGIPRAPFCLWQINGSEQTEILVAILLMVIVMACTLVKPPSGLRPPFSDITPDMASPSSPVAAPDLEPTTQLADNLGLTNRETEVLVLICAGRTRSYISDTLFISENTVKYHTKNLYRKAGVTSKQELIDLYRRARGGT